VALVALRDRDDEAEVGVDHPLLRREVAALDALGERDLVGRGQQLVAAGLVQEQLEGIRRDCGRSGAGRLDGVLLGLRPQLDLALFERASQFVEVLPLDVVLEGERLELALLEEASLGGLVEQRLDVCKLEQLVQNDPLSYRGQLGDSSNARKARSAPSHLFKRYTGIAYSMRSRVKIH
jgi:hypothetical protein